MTRESSAPDGRHADRTPFAVDADAAARRLVLRGELDFSSAHLVLEAAGLLDADRGATQSAVLTVQMDRLMFIDAAGIGVLVRLNEAEKAAHRRLVLRGLSPRLARVLRLADADSLLGGPAGPACGHPDVSRRRAPARR